MTTLGHVVFYVRDLQTSVKFYTDIVGLDLKGFIFNNSAALSSGGNTNHELLLIQVVLLLDYCRANISACTMSAGMW